MDGLLKAFADTDRRDREYVLDTDSGTVHFVPVKLLRLAEDGKLDPATVAAQDKERAAVAQAFLDDIAGRYELVPYVEPGSEDEWKAEFLTEKKAAALTDALTFEWNVYKAARLQDEVVSWLEQTDMFGDGDDGESEDWEPDDEE
jgi:hypothetical protein